MIDIHTHILPGIDDGARDSKESEAMLAMQWESGVDRVFLTPHFYPERTALDRFLPEREKAWSVLESDLNAEEKKRIRLGAEVRYCPQLLTLDLRKLTLGDSDYLLLELPGRNYPAYAVQITQMLLEKGIVPIFAHVERYIYFRETPDLLKRLIDMGALAQVSAGALFDKRDRNFAQACLQHHLAQLVASDAHNITDRKPCMELVKKLPEEIQQLHNVFADAIWDNEVAPYIKATNVKKTFWGYR